MKSYNVHGKELPVPSFFQVYNYGGGNGDKDREIVYAELTKDTPKLINYFYINNEYPHTFQSKYFDHVENYSTVGDLFNDIRKKLILEKGEIYSSFSSQPVDFNKSVFLLDSGAFNIIKQIAKSANYDVSAFKTEIVDHMKRYYDFANSLKIDIVVGFDLGGKYTKKDQETKDEKLNAFFDSIDADELNNYLLEETIKYLKSHKDYYPLVLATVHGKNQNEFSQNTKYILALEEQYGVKFWGFALGGIASAKGLDVEWCKDLDFSGVKKRKIENSIAPARASKVVRNLVGDRPIHALGCGGYPNIAMNYYCGATSFDAASPVRRVGDGNELSTHYVFSSSIPKEAKFSKYLNGGIKMNGELLPGDCDYITLNKMDDNYPLCGCYACNKVSSFHQIKELYAMKELDSEANYYSRQLMGLHAVNQHTKLCRVISECSSFDDLYLRYPNALNKDIKRILDQI